MAKLTQAQWQAQIDACGPEIQQDDVLNLLYKDGPNAMFQEVVKQRHVLENRMYRYLTNIFPTRVLEDWSGTTEIGEEYHSPHIPFDPTIFQRTMESCDPRSSNDCDTTYCDIPRGGITKLPDHEMYKAGLKTPRECIAAIRTSAKVRQVAKAMLEERFQAEDQVINIFYISAMIRMLGHKYVLEYENINGGSATPLDSTNPYNPVQAFRYAYMQPRFAAPSSLQNVGPLDLSTLDIFGRGFAKGRAANAVATGARGEPIYELWHSEDWYQREVLTNPEYQERNKYFIKQPIIYGHRGYDAPNQEAEVVGNFKLKQMDSLPRFAESTTGGIAMIQQYVDTPVDIGTRPTWNFRQYNNAPFLLTVMLGTGAGEILSRPALSTGIHGMPIMPITGNGSWVYRNDYDKECNPDLNKPYMQKRFELGFKLKDADKSMGIIHRNRIFRLRPINTCDLVPIFAITPDTSLGCEITTIGCNPTNDRLSNNIMDDESEVRRVKCSSIACGDSASLTYNLVIRRESIDSISPNQEPLQGCGCGDTIDVWIGDADGDTVKIRTATIIDYIRPNVVNPSPIYVVRLASALSANECVQYIGCRDDSPTTSTVVYCVDNSDNDDIPAGSVRFSLDSALPCNVGATVTITYRDADGDAIGATVSGTIVSINPDTMVYEISSADTSGTEGTAAFNCVMRADQASITIVCA